MTLTRGRSTVYGLKLLTCVFCTCQIEAGRPSERYAIGGKTIRDGNPRDLLDGQHIV